MKIVANTKLIRRNSLIGQITIFSSLAILVGSFLISIRYPNLYIIAYVGLLLGFVLTQVGIYYGSRFGRSPRPDEMLNKSLEGMDNRYSIYHYILPVPHVLIGPAGIWVLQPKQQLGKVTYEKNRWKIKGGGVIQGYLRLFGQEGIGRPDLEVKTEVENTEKYLHKVLPDVELPAIQAVLVFTHPQTVIEADEAPIPTVSAARLKEYIRSTAKGKTISPEKVKEITSALGEG